MNKVGSVFIDYGNSNNEGDIIYAKIIGIREFKELANIIEKRVELFK
jgi:hypothetical protein